MHDLDIVHSIISLVGWFLTVTGLSTFLRTVLPIFLHIVYLSFTDMT
jgi:hypothetical protein